MGFFFAHRSSSSSNGVGTECGGNRKKKERRRRELLLRFAVAACTLLVVLTVRSLTLSGRATLLSSIYHDEQLHVPVVRGSTLAGDRHHHLEKSADFRRQETVLADAAHHRVGTSTVTDIEKAVDEDIGREVVGRIPSEESSNLVPSQEVGNLSLLSQPLPPLLTVIVPVYDSYKFIGRLMNTLWNQTYSNLEVIFSVELTEDATLTESILKQHQERAAAVDSIGPIRKIRIYMQQHRLYYVENMNFLLDMVETEFYSYMQTDDELPPNYYEKLVNCLQENLNAVNCYPDTIYRINGDDDELSQQRMPSKKLARREKSAVGPLHERVEQVVLGESFSC